jgi:hypothetical protein
MIAIAHPGSIFIAVLLITAILIVLFPPTNGGKWA